MKYSIKHFLILLFCLNIVQAFLTPIARDEAYYWMFGQNLDWGYFDHPPVVGLMTYLGSLLFDGELGVRLLTVFLSVGFAYLIWLMIPPETKEKKHSIVIFSLLFLASPLFNIYGFVTTPDMPLLFFSAAYLFGFQQFNQRPNWKKALFLGFLMACLIYSKYHGILVILLSVVSNLKLFRQPLFYLSALFGVILYLPHLYWQWTHDFVSFEYHLLYRSDIFEWSNVFNYLLNVVLVFNPFLFPLFIISLTDKGTTNGRSRLMNFIFWGFFLFFLFTSSRGHVEPHWVAVGAIPLTIYLVHFLSNHEKYLKSFKIIGITSLLIVFCARLIIVLPLSLKSEFHREKADFYQGILKLAEGRKVIFTDSYTHAAKFSFYTGQRSFSYNFISYRKNQYDLMDVKDVFHEKNAMVVTFWPFPSFKTVQFENAEDFHYNYYDSLPLYNSLRIDNLTYNAVVHKGDLNRIEMTIHNPYDIDLDFTKKYASITWELYYFDSKKERHSGVPIQRVKINYLKANGSQTFTAYFQSDSVPGKYTIAAAIRPYRLFPIAVSKRNYPIEVIAK